MAEGEKRPPTKLETVQAYLTEEDHFVSRRLNEIESTTGVQKKLVLNVFAVLLILALVLLEPPEMQFISNWIVLPYPLVRTFASLASEDIDELKIWLLYWFIHMSYEFADPYLGYVPFYWLTKTVLLLCMSLPPIGASRKLYFEWIKPVCRLKQKTVDKEVLMKAHPKLLKKLSIDSEKIQSMDEKEIQAKLAKVDTDNVLLHILRPQTEQAAD